MADGLLMITCIVLFRSVVGKCVVGQGTYISVMLEYP